MFTTNDKKNFTNLFIMDAQLVSIACTGINNELLEKVFNTNKEPLTEDENFIIPKSLFDKNSSSENF